MNSKPLWPEFQLESCCEASASGAVITQLLPAWVRRRTHHRVLFGVVLRDGDVVVGDFGSVCCRLLSVPHDVVQVWKVVIHVDAFVAVAPLRPAGQFWALGGVQWNHVYASSIPKVPVCLILHVRSRLLPQWYYFFPPPGPPFSSVLTRFISFFTTLTRYCLSILSVLTRSSLGSQHLGLICATQKPERGPVSKKKTNKKRRIPVSWKRAFSFPPLHKQFRSHRGSWTAGGGFGSPSPAGPRAGCPSCILCTSTAWGWGRARGRGPRCRAFPPRSETPALLPVGAFTVNVGQREHESSIRDQDRSTSGSGFSPSSETIETSLACWLYWGWPGCERFPKVM